MLSGQLTTIHSCSSSSQIVHCSTESNKITSNTASAIHVQATVTIQTNILNFIQKNHTLINW